MAQASTRVALTKMKKAQAWTLALSWGLAVMIYSLSQGFFTHNSGNLFYFFLTIVWYALFTTQQGNIKKMA